MSSMEYKMWNFCVAYASVPHLTLRVLSMFYCGDDVYHLNTSGIACILGAYSILSKIANQKLQSVVISGNSIHIYEHQKGIVKVHKT